MNSSPCRIPLSWRMVLFSERQIQNHTAQRGRRCSISPLCTLLARFANLAGSGREPQVKRLVSDESAEQQVGVVVEPVEELELVEPEEHLEGLGKVVPGARCSETGGRLQAHLTGDVEVRDDAQHSLDEDAEHVRVEALCYAADVLVEAPG